MNRKQRWSEFIHVFNAMKMAEEAPKHVRKKVNKRKNRYDKKDICYDRLCFLGSNAIAVPYQLKFFLAYLSGE